MGMQNMQFLTELNMIAFGIYPKNPETHIAQRWLRHSRQLAQCRPHGKANDVSPRLADQEPVKREDKWLGHEDMQRTEVHILR